MERKMDQTMRQVQFYRRHLEVFDPYCAAQMVLMDLCIPANCEGHDYLLNAIVERYKHPEAGFEQGIYSVVAERYPVEVSTRQMETAIRYVIKKAWKDRKESVWVCFFPSDNWGNLKKPSNTDFISEIARFMRLWERCDKGGEQPCRTTELNGNCCRQSSWTRS